MSNRSARFTLIELLVVVAIIAVLAGMLMPAFIRARHLAWRISCAGNLRQFGQLLDSYADDANAFYPLEPTEHNPHPDLLGKMGLSVTDSVVSIFYCPRADFMEEFANDPHNYWPRSGGADSIDSVVDTPANREAGNFTYVYWSFLENRPGWRNTPPFTPRRLRNIGAVATPGFPDPVPASASERWVASDFFRRGAPFPHGTRHA